MYAGRDVYIIVAINRCVNEAYEALRRRVPEEFDAVRVGAAGLVTRADRRISKVETLRSAVRYIRFLAGLIDDDSPSSSKYWLRDESRLPIRHAAGPRRWWSSKRLERSLDGDQHTWLASRLKMTQQIKNRMKCRLQWSDWKTFKKARRRMTSISVSLHKLHHSSQIDFFISVSLFETSRRLVYRPSLRWFCPAPISSMVHDLYSSLSA